MSHPATLSPWSACSILLLCLPLAAQRGADLVERDPEAAPVRRALEASGDQVQLFDQHVTTLSSPFMEGRVPGSKGMVVARDYFEHYLRQAGTLPPWRADDGARSYRQPFRLRGSREVTHERVAAGDLELTPGIDFSTLGLGAGGALTAPVVFVGYGVEEAEDGYTSFPADEQLDGKIALLLRHEPMDADGNSLWAEAPQPWTRNARLSVKVRNLARRNAAGVILVNTPGAADPRAGELLRSGGGGRAYAGGPVVHLTEAAARQLLAEVAPGEDLTALRQQSDRGGVVKQLGAVTLEATLETKDLIAENVGGVLPGRGGLAEEWIVVGAHLDHLGVGLYGARDPSRVGQLHPGADDNASGSAGVLMLAERMRAHYDAMPDGAQARSILFVGWDAEEAGLHGSRHYVGAPLAPLEQHALCVNFDMIGRIVNKRLSVSGTTSAEGMADWLQPLFEASPIDVVQDPGMGPGGSDHLAFMSKRVPWLFAIIKDFHADYHTPDDVAWKINRVDAVHTIDLFEQIVLTAAQRSEPFEYQRTSGGRRRGR